MSVYFLSDPHFGHRNIHKFRHTVSSPEDNERKIIDEWKAKINKRGTVYVLGDAAFNDDALSIFDTLPGRKILIKGNHDDLVATSKQAQVFAEIHGMLKYKKMWLTHCPMHPDELRGKPNVHGHVHNYSIMKRTWYGKRVLDTRYLNLCPEFVIPIFGKHILTLDELKQYFNL